MTKTVGQIACCSMFYKAIAKLLVNRLQSVLADLIGYEQSAFIKDRSIQDNILLAHELVHKYGRSHISPRAMIKVDIRKAYDTVEWDFVLCVLQGMGFPQQFIGLIMVCVTSSSFSVVVNGTPEGWFHGRRGLRQGDPLSPYLFVLCMEVFSRMCRRAVHSRIFAFHPKCKKIGLSHLIFADDLLVFSHGNVDAVSVVTDLLGAFGEMSGLKTNEAKSCIYFGGVSQENQQVILERTGFTKGELPFKYLWVPLASSRITYAMCQPLLKKILGRIQLWSSWFYPMVAGSNGFQLCYSLCKLTGGQSSSYLKGYYMRLRQLAVILVDWTSR